MDKYDFATILPIKIQDNFQSYPDFLQRLLFRRGIKNFKEAEEFLNPDYENHLHDPFLLPDIEKAAERIIEAVEKNQKIVIYSDYDADGIPGGVILHDFFKLIGFENFQNYIPHRHTEGFGLNMDAVEKFVEEKADLIITVDCGTSDLEQIKKAKELGLEIIVTDHHEQKETLPEAFAVVNPKRKDSKYPFPMICGSAVAFKLVQVILSKKDFGLKRGTEKWLLDMVGIATLSDMVPLIGENRVLAHYGIKVLRKSRRPGLTKLLFKLGINKNNLSEDDIGFMVTPRINAASRMGNPEDAFILLATRDGKEAEEAVSHLNKINDERKGAVASIVKEIKHKFEVKEDSKVIVTGNPSWRPSLLGLVAGKLAEEFKRPVFLWGRDGENVIKGSCRSDGKVNVLAMMERTEKCFVEYGGHKMAGGFSVTHTEVHFLENRLEEAFENLKAESQNGEKITLEERLSPDEITWQNQNILEKLSPFGVGNPKPLFLLEDLEIDSIRNFGKQKKHLEIKFSEPKLNSVKAISFFADEDLKEKLKSGIRINLIASIEKHVFNGSRNLRLRVQDIFIRE